ncbi:MAG: hypothetical protein GX800_09235 [Clostridiaceae bacterium]|nr:hypothetical protein [Clostridiaceae bacterium]
MIYKKGAMLIVLAVLIVGGYIFYESSKQINQETNKIIPAKTSGEKYLNKFKDTEKNAVIYHTLYENIFADGAKELIVFFYQDGDSNKASVSVVSDDYICTYLLSKETNLSYVDKDDLTVVSFDKVPTIRIPLWDNGSNRTVNYMVQISKTNDGTMTNIFTEQ